MSGGRRLYDVLAEVARAEGVGTCFALLGDANMAWATRLMQRGARLVTVRHEHCAVAAATAWSRKTGEPGVATVTCGPGLTQVLTALPAAVRARVPLVVLAGEAPIGAAWYNQAIDQAPFVVAAGAVYRRLLDPGRMAEAFRDAFLEARTDRVPVVVGVPFDLQAEDWSGSALPEPSLALIPRPGAVPPAEDDLSQAAALVAGKRRIVVMAGLGAVEAGAGPACAALAARLEALLATSLPARGLFATQPHCLGIAGGFSTAAGRACLARADLIIAVGCRLAQHNTDRGKLWPRADVLQIDLVPSARSQGATVARHHLRADARLGVEALTAAVPPQAGWRSPGLARFLADTPADPATFPAEPGLLDPRDVVAALDAALPDEWEMVNSSGHCSWFFAQMPGRAQERFLTIREFGAIGNGISYAIGVALARPEARVVLFDGDGSLLMHVQELETIRRLGLRILICVLNDGAYGSEIHKLRDDGLPEDGAVFGRTDLAAIARGFGLEGAQVDDLSALPDLMRRLEAAGGAAVWDFQVSDRVASPVIRRAHPGGHSGTERAVTLPEDA